MYWQDYWKAIDYNEVNIKHPHLPKGARVPRNQVAGHKHEGRSKLGLLEHEDGSILKAMQNPPRWKRERDFYKRVFDKNCDNKDTFQLQHFIPRFYGVSQFVEYPDVQYLKLENIAKRFRKPCVVDVKMGQKTYDPEACPSKIARQLVKFPHAEKFGFQITGMQIYDPVQKSMKFYDKFYWRNQEEDFLIPGLGTFFNIKHGPRKDAIRDILQKLNKIKCWFETQRTFSFYGSSLLIIYEGSPQQTTTYNDFVNYSNGCDKNNSKTDSLGFIHSDKSSSGGTNNTESSSESASTNNNAEKSEFSSIDMGFNQDTDDSHLTNLSEAAQKMSTVYTSNSSHNAILTDVRMIDFTHVFDVNEQDDNYLYGLRNLISNLEQLLEL